jgi:2-polyprenyl-3-methyl-5-hydroxy-6-metoxy-1,4-benzoquinol methylase
MFRNGLHIRDENQKRMATTTTVIRPEMETVSHCLLCDSVRIGTVDAEFNLRRCEACGYVFDSPRPTLTAIVNFYSAPKKYDGWLVAERSREGLWKRRLRKLLKNAVRGNLLDVGAGIGQFLNLARPHFTHVSGTEVSETAVRLAKEKYGLDLWQGQIEDCELPQQSFDTITLFHVLEHVPDPKKTIARCRELLKVGGVLLVCVPNDILAWTSKIKILGKKLGLGSFGKFSPALGIPRVFTSHEIHLSHFTPLVLRRLLEQEKLEYVEQSLDPYYAFKGVKQILHIAYSGFHRAVFVLTHANRYDTIWMMVRKVTE